MSSPPPNDEPERLRKAVAQLRALEREVLFLSAGEGLSNEALATRLGISPRRAERLLARALAKLGRAMEPRPRRWWRFR